MDTQPAAPESKIYEGEAAGHRLAEFGLREIYFADAAQRGHDRRERCEDVHPASYPGQVMWAETTAELRTQLLDLSQGWKIGHERNYETVYNRRRRIAIVVVGGNVHTGIRSFEPPKTARPRGPVTEIRVGRNVKGQLTLDLEGMPDDESETEYCFTWFFLLSARKNKLYSELSLPTAMGKSDRISRWAERILFTPQELVGAVTPINPEENSGERPHVHVGRK